MFSRDDDAWMGQSVDPDSMWPSTANEVAGVIGGEGRLAEPRKGFMPFTPGPDDDDDLAEADSSADAPPPPDANSPGPDAQGDAPLDSSMSEREIRDAGLRIDLPAESPDAVMLNYKATGQQTWTPPPGWRS